MKIFAVSGWAGSGKDTVAEYLIKTHGFRRVAFADILKDMVAEQYGIDRSSLDDRDRKEKPLLHMPVNPKDNYSKMINEYLVKEFRSAAGYRPVGFEYQGAEFYGVFYVDPSTGTPVHPTSSVSPGVKELYRVYWTPRALAILEGSTKRSANSNYWVERAARYMAELSAGCPDRNFVISDVRYKNEIDQLRSLAPGAVVPIRVNRFDTTASTDSSERDLDDYLFQYAVSNKGTFEELFSKVDGIVRIETSSSNTATGG